MSYEKRILITLAACMALLFLWEVLFVQPETKRRQAMKRQVAATPTAVSAPERAVTAAALAQTALPGGLPGPATPPAEHLPPVLVELDGGRWRGAFSSRGGTIARWRVPRYYADAKTKEPLDLIQPAPGAPLVLETTFADRLPLGADYTVERASALSVRMTTQTGGLRLIKEVTARPDSYYLDLRLVLSNLSETAARGPLSLWISDWADPKVQTSSGWFAPPHFNLTAYCYSEELSSADSDKLKETPFERAPAIWGGVSRQYFLLALLPGGAGEAAPANILCRGVQSGLGHVVTELRWPDVALAPGAEREFKAVAFLGPKTTPELKKIDRRLEASVDFGMLGFLCRPMLWFLTSAQTYVINWGLAILVLTLVVKMLLYPLTYKSFVSMRAMAGLKPDMDQLKEKYREDKTKLNQELMELYRKKGVNPLGGCLPVLLQMPIWFALYRTLYTSVDLYQARFIPGWIDDLGAPDPFWILPVVLGLITFVQQKMTPTTMDSSQAKIMLYVMPPMFAMFMLSLPAGLTLYIVFNSVLSIFQQMLINRTAPAKK